MDASAASRLPARGAWAPELPEAAGFEHTVVSLPGLRVHVASIGAGEPVVMLHGFPQHWWEWRSVAPRVAAAGYRVICPDLRGSGWTEAAEPGFTRHVMRNDLVALLDRLSISEAHVISHDLGAVVAGQVSYLHPERVRSAVQFAVPPGFMAFSPRLLPAFAHMPRLLMHRPGEWTRLAVRRSLRGEAGDGGSAGRLPACAAATRGGDVDRTAVQRHDRPRSDASGVRTLPAPASEAADIGGLRASRRPLRREHGAADLPRIGATRRQLRTRLRRTGGALHRRRRPRRCHRRRP